MLIEQRDHLLLEDIIKHARFLLVLLVFARGLGGEFVMDDWPVVKENSKITETKYIPDYFSRGVWSNTDLAAETGVQDRSLYRPLFLLTLNLGHQLWGDSALGYHALNLLLHGINTVLLYFLIIGFLPAASRMIAGMSTAIFAVHPLHVESVAWASMRKDGLAGFGFALTLMAYAHYVERPSGLRYAAVSLALVLGLLAKPIVVTLPCVLLLLDF